MKQYRLMITTKYSKYPIQWGGDYPWFKSYNGVIERIRKEIESGRDAIRFTIESREATPWEVEEIWYKEK